MTGSWEPLVYEFLLVQSLLQIKDIVQRVLPSNALMSEPKTIFGCNVPYLVLNEVKLLENDVKIILLKDINKFYI